MAPGISTLGPLHGQVRLCLQTAGSLQTVFQVYSHWAWENVLQGWVGPVWGPLLPLFQSWWLCLLSDHVQLTALQLSTKGQSCTPHSF